MKFIVYSLFGERSIHDNLGRPDADYYFARAAFLPALAELGTVEAVQNPDAEVDPIYERCAEQGEACVFLSFAPPHKTPIDLKCPTVPVIAWGFDNIPDEAWDGEPRNDWRFVLGKLGRAITLSGHAARAIGAAMGPDFPVRAIAPPVVARTTEPALRAFANSGIGGIELTLRGGVIDSRTAGLSADLLSSPQRPTAVKDEPPANVEPHHSMLPHPTDEPPAPPQPAAPAGATAISVGSTSEGAMKVTLSGVVYTAVLDPADIDANWIDMVTAFCWTFRDTSDATLVLNMLHHDQPAYWSEFVWQLARLSPFKCRIVALHGPLEDVEREKLIAATSFYVNAASCQAWCRPLMEFLGRGRPAIAPAHTAMADYVDDKVAFVLRASRELSTWPHDRRELCRTTCYRLDWQSLVDAFGKSYRLITDAPEQYAAMAERAQSRMQKSYSISAVTRQLGDFLRESAAAAEDLPVREPAPAAAADRGGRELT